MLVCDVGITKLYFRVVMRGLNMINKENDGTLCPYDDLEEAKTNMG